MSRRLPPALLCLGLAFAACTSKKPASPAPDHAPAIASPAAPTPPPAPGPDLALPALVEVEVMGTVTAPKKAPAGKVLVVLTDGPCFQPGSHYLGSQALPAPGQRFFIEVFPPEGTSLWACAALVVGGNRTTPWIGRAKKSPLLAKGRGEVIFDPTDIALEKGPPVTIPAGLHLE